MSDARAKYIDREALGIGKCNPEAFVDKGYANGWNAAIEIIQSAPAADVRPVVRGKWIETKTGFHCSACKSKAKGTKAGALLSNFCPNCGAKMEES